MAGDVETPFLSPSQASGRENRCAQPASAANQQVPLQLAAVVLMPAGHQAVCLHHGRMLF